MSDLGLLSYYLGIEVEQGSRGITLCQSAYVKWLLDRSGMSGCKGCQTPMEEKLKLSKDNTMAKVDATRYQSIVGGLRYLTHTRPDINFVVGYVSRFMEDPREDHLTTVKHLLGYIAGTSGYNIIYPRQRMTTLELTWYNNSDMAGHIDGRKSTSGVLFFLSDCPITWQSQKQKIVTLSTYEAEYITAVEGCEGVWLAWLLKELTGEKLWVPALMVDNKSAIALAKNPVQQTQRHQIPLHQGLHRGRADQGRVC
jgi:hypothetical protein